MPIGEYALLCVPACDLPFKVIGGRCFLVENFAKGAWADTNHWCGYYGATLAKLDDASVFAALVQEIKDSDLEYGERAKDIYRLHVKRAIDIVEKQTALPLSLYFSISAEDEVNEKRIMIHLHNTGPCIH
ncbi:uncharacterized protein [Penaeus vannamei]|uniref:uncharacterized protein n=1 Tax=Penaeus vannamei TaxID=6689 RepID=UPI00387F4A79